MSRASDAKRMAESIARSIVHKLRKPHGYFAGTTEESLKAQFVGTVYDNDEQFILDVANRLPICLKRKGVRCWYNGESKFDLTCIKSRGWR